MCNHSSGPDNRSLTDGHSRQNTGVFPDPDILMDDYRAFGVQLACARRQCQTFFVGISMTVVCNKDIASKQHVVANDDFVDDPDVYTGVESDMVADGKLGIAVGLFDTFHA